MGGGFSFGSLERALRRKEVRKTDSLVLERLWGFIAVGGVLKPVWGGFSALDFENLLGLILSLYLTFSGLGFSGLTFSGLSFSGLTSAFSGLTLSGLDFEDLDFEGRVLEVDLPVVDLPPDVVGLDEVCLLDRSREDALRLRGDFS